jgi:site-specific recombinase XerD
MDTEHPKTFLFNGNEYDSRYSQRGVQWAVKSLCKKAAITKDVNVHTLRHTLPPICLKKELILLPSKNYWVMHA